MQKYVIAARSINGIVFWNGRAWTDERSKSFRYAKYEKALKSLISRYSKILYDIRALALVVRSTTD